MRMRMLRLGYRESVVEEQGRVGTLAQEVGRGFPPPFLLKPLSRATRAEDTPRPVEMSTITHVSIHYPRLPCAFPRP